MTRVKMPRWGRAPSGRRHFLQECLRMTGELEAIVLFGSKPASAGVPPYQQEFKPPTTARVFRDTTAGAAPVGLCLLRSLS